MSIFPIDLNKQAIAGWQTSSSSPRPEGVKHPPSINGNEASTSTSNSNPTSTPVPTEKPRSVKRLRPNPVNLAEKYRPPDLRLSMLGGLDTQITQLLEIVALPLQHPEIYAHTGVSRPRGVLLHGVPGGGKTQLVKCLAGELGLPFISVSAPSIVSGMSGESEKTLRDTFDEAKKLAPCLLFLDEVDAITPKRETAQREMERRIVAQLLTCMDDMASSEEPVVIIGATNRPDSLDTALRRAGRFDHEIEMGVPGVEAREQILKVLCTPLKLTGDVDFRWLAKATPGYVGADLTSLVTEAGVIAVKRIFEDLSSQPLSTSTPFTRPPSTDIDDQSFAISNGDIDIDPPIQSLRNVEISSDGPLSSLSLQLRQTPIARFLLTHPYPLPPESLDVLSIHADDFVQALKIVQPSAKREGFATIPDVSWSDIGALGEVRDELHMAIVQPIRRPELFAVVGIEAPSGVLLWGPPGCGKTLLAKAVANESRANFISVKGPELLNKYVGESERAVRQVFARARASSPCVIFFDELDALVPRRDESMSESSARVVNTLLTELDGLNSRKSVYVIGATNRPDMIDPAMVRPGRLDKLLYVDLPTPSERVEILKTHTKRTPIPDSAWSEIEVLVTGDQCDGYSGADLAALVREAATLALRKALESMGAFETDLDVGGSGNQFGDVGEGRGTNGVRVGIEEFKRAAEKTKPSVSREQRLRYERMRDKYAGVPTKGRRREENGLGDVNMSI
ncbi:hypothetical protein TREMEDRAFT_68499 [Tremella mesenterica DSM 1558]|uniref:uncharacterized protein n=1 Tax=Tremella mesenterica (strain ATCC 24925 / CBS 8224 / DSM 1558 / NBRC 9311 / NRRL Y-6157 / RJB 2259-6 / UBC 559-6) TaxID=578456 RepID=UPI0003F49082|nr:uncharacterized protein TREMEDRAFT_68499 [Tremella mesenterica DSM 1558]EIW70123.1 hypothetical protein TREMEDRAFT_68499 [Tremella mesenterica DSM 1558]